MQAPDHLTLDLAGLGLWQPRHGLWLTAELSAEGRVTEARQAEGRGTPRGISKPQRGW